MLNLNKNHHRHSEFISESIRHCEQSEAIWLENSRHPELDSGSTRHCEQSEAISSRLPRATALAMTEQTGRSMVEMLGVLAVIGVLSITGISGYTTAMNKHRANEILDAASKRAVAVSTQIQRGNTSPTLDEFGDETAKGVSFSLKATDGNAWATGQSRFALQTSAIDEDICREIYNITGTSGTVREMYSNAVALSSSSGCSETASAMRFVYNNDLTNTAVAGDYKTEADCEATGVGKYWCTDHCVESASDCGPSCAAYTGTSTTGLGGYAGKADDSSTACYCKESGTTYQTDTCATAPTGCSSYKDCDKGRFCYFGDSVSCDDTCPYYDTGSCSSGTGTCTAISGDYAFPSAVSITGIGSTWKGPVMDWYSANDWCKANDKELISVEDLKCYKNGTTQIVIGGIGGYCCENGKSCAKNDWSARTTNALFSSVIVEIASQYGTDFYPWTSSVYNGSGNDFCNTFQVFLDIGKTSGKNRNYYGSPLCK